MQLFKLFLIFSFIFLIFGCSSKNENQQQENIIITECDCYILKLDNKYIRFYLSDKKNPFSGTCEIKNAEGSTLSKREFLDGKYHGDYIDYYPNGQVMSLKTYKNHFLNGDFKEFTDNGKLINHSIYKQSTLVETVEYHPELY
jgi:antitoxin component YwqK of YwqJK toxin-antitoxin module